MLKGLFQNLLINRICPNPLMFLQGVVFSKMFAENSMKMKEIGPRGHMPISPPGSTSTVHSMFVDFKDWVPGYRGTTSQ